MPNENSLWLRLGTGMRARIQWIGEPLVVLLSALLSLAIHAHYMVTGLGESDAARFARIAFLWHVRGKIRFDEVGYQIRTSTLYLQLEKVALDHGVSMHSLPSLLNWTSVVLGTACSVALYVLFRKLTTRPIAAAATLVHAVTPGFWLGNVFGMPTVPGLLFLVLSLTVFVTATQSLERGWRLAARLLLAWFFMALAMTIKSDLSLCGGAFLAAAFARPTQRLRYAAYATLIVVGGTAASLGYARLVVLPSPEVTAPVGGLFSFFKQWNAAFAISLDALLTDSNNTVIPRCVGGLLFGVIVVAVLYGLVIGGRLRGQAIAALLWSVPPILAWGLRFGNSARHNVPAFPPLVLFATIFMFEIMRQETRRALTLIGAVVVLSYFSNTSGEDSLRPQSNVIALSESIAWRTRRSHEAARRLANSTAQMRAIIAGYADPYTEFEVLSDMKHPTIEIGDTWIVTENGRTTVIDYGAYLEHKSSKQLARYYRSKGYEVLSMSYRL